MKPCRWKDGVLTLIEGLVEVAIEAEIESYLSQKLRNQKNTKSSKEMKSSTGEFELNAP